MIDWPNLFANTLWILALAAALAVVSTASWRASLEKTRTRTVLTRKNMQLSLLGCLVLFALGVTLSVPSTLEKLAWGALTLLTLVQFGIVMKK
jgi:hypothetical protein